MTRVLPATCLALAAFSSLLPGVLARDLTFEEGVRAQEAIERVYYSHQIGARAPFEEAVPRAVLERKVREFVERVDALARSGRVRTSAQDVERELRRIAADTRFPQRLREIYRALDGDPILVQECFVRPLLEQARHPILAAVEKQEGSPARRSPETVSLPVPLPEPASVLADDVWHPGILDDAPTTRYAHSAVWTGSLMIVWGGRTTFPSTPKNTGYRYDPVAALWTPMSSAGAPSGRFGHAAVWTGSRMIVWGGTINTGGTLTDTGGMYDPVADSWKATPTSGAPMPRSSFTAVWSGSRMVVWGGSNTDTGGRYDPELDQWHPTSLVDAPAPRASHSAVWTGTVMVVWGGSNLQTGGRYDPERDVWTPTSTAGAPGGRSDHAAVWTGNEMLVWGGADAGGVLASGGRYSPASDTWAPMSAVGAPAGRRDPAAAWTGSEMLVWGGGLLGTGGRYDPVDDAWSPTSTLGAPVARSEHTAVWTGDRFLAWGGRLVQLAGDAEGSTNGGGSYDPITDRWTMIHPPELSTIRSHVWTGNVALLWGGTTPHRTLTNGARYDPIVDVWLPLSAAGAPGGRTLPSAVWTGTEMIVWGGRAQSGARLGDGARYDPIADTWTPTGSTGAPSARYDHVAVWTGAEMIVWGGDAADLYTGARYDPATDAWVPTSSVGAPALYTTSAVWTGSEMILWGGRVSPSNAATSNEGARYDPISDTWTPTSTSNAPSARSDNSAVWTGRRMVVWGGFQGGPGPVDTGGRYDPLSDTWEPTTTTGAPTARSLHSAIWTGGRMVVWGGTGLGGPLFNTGARYDPVNDVFTPVTTSGAPPLSVVSAIWTGSDMMVWGATPTNSRSEGSLYAIAIDTDADGVLDQQDCDPWNPQVIGPAGEATSLTLDADRVTLTWTAAPSASIHDVLRGDATSLPVGGPSEVCLAVALAGTSATDPATPSEGGAFYYLVRGRNDCGGGSYGFESGGAQRSSAACP